MATLNEALPENLERERERERDAAQIGTFAHPRTTTRRSITNANALAGSGQPVLRTGQRRIELASVRRALVLIVKEKSV